METIMVEVITVLSTLLSEWKLNIRVLSRTLFLCKNIIAIMVGEVIESKILFFVI